MKEGFTFKWASRKILRKLIFKNFGGGGGGLEQKRAASSTREYISQPVTYIQVFLAIMYHDYVIFKLLIKHFFSN